MFSLLAPLFSSSAVRRRRITHLHQPPSPPATSAHAHPHSISPPRNSITLLLLPFSTPPPKPWTHGLRAPRRSHPLSGGLGRTGTATWMGSTQPHQARRTNSWQAQIRVGLLGVGPRGELGAGAAGTRRPIGGGTGGCSEKAAPVLENWKNRLQATLSYTSLEAYCRQVKRCVEIALNCVEADRLDRPSIGTITNMLSETETGCQEKETVTSTELLGIHPLELRFPFEPNKLIPCPLHLTNSTDHRIAFRLQPGSPERYFAEWLCGVVPPRSIYTLVVTMKEQQLPPPDADEFLIEQSSVMGEDELKYISQGKADITYDNFFTEYQEKSVDKVHELTLTAVCDPQGQTSSEIISTMNFDKMVSMDVHPTKPWIITGHFNGHICIWNYQTKAMVNSFEVAREQEVLTAKFIAKKQWIVAGGGDGRIYVYSYNTMKRVKSFKALSNQVTSLAIHPTKPYVLSASYDLVIKLWDWENGWKCSRIFEEKHSSSVMQAAFNPKDTNAFASVSKDKTVKIWSVDSPHSKLTLAGHSSNVRCLDYFVRGDKQYLITGSDDATAKIWDLQKKCCVKTLEGHANRVSSVCSHPELPILLTGSRDGTVRLWNSNTFKLEGILNFGLRKVHALGCMKGSRRVVIGHSHGLAIMEIDHEGHVVNMDKSENAL